MESRKEREVVQRPLVLRMCSEGVWAGPFAVFLGSFGHPPIAANTGTSATRHGIHIPRLAGPRRPLHHIQYPLFQNQLKWEITSETTQRVVTMLQAAAT